VVSQEYLLAGKLTPKLGPSSNLLFLRAPWLEWSSLKSGCKALFSIVLVGVLLRGQCFCAARLPLTCKPPGLPLSSNRSKVRLINSEECLYLSADWVGVVSACSLACAQWFGTPGMSDPCSEIASVQQPQEQMAAPVASLSPIPGPALTLPVLLAGGLDVTRCLLTFLSPTDQRSLLNTTRLLAEIKQHLLFWKLTKDQCRIIYPQPSFRLQIETLAHDPSLQLCLRFNGDGIADVSF
jgi:hypothetical protein